MKIFPQSRPIAVVGLLFGGTLLGAVVATVIASDLRIQEGRQEVRDYAGRLIRAAEQRNAEQLRAVNAVLNDNLPFCSDQDLEFMRDYVFHSSDIRDLGRLKNGHLYCTTGVGRLKSPLPVVNPDVRTADSDIYVRRHLLISPTTLGIVVERSEVSLVLDPAAGQRNEEPPRYYYSFVYDEQKQRLVQSFGAKPPLTTAQILAGRLIELDGVIYQPACSRTAVACIIAAENRRDIVARKGSFFIGLLAAGSLVGLAAGAIILLLYKKQRSLEWQLRRAIRSGKIDLVYQPVVDLETEAIVGAEVLARWTNDAGEVVRPDVFIAIAEEKGFVSEITRFVVRKALQEMGDLLTQRGLKLTINITAEDLGDPEFPSFLQQTVRAAGVLPACIGLELTERSTAKQDLAIQTIRNLRSAGYLVYIDDFGTGYSSLSYLHTLAVDAIKIDRGFTKTVGTEAITASVVPQIMSMAAQLNLLVVVEGIETEEQAEYFLTSGRVLQAQGWLYGKPASAEGFQRMVREGMPRRVKVSEIAH